MEVDAYNFHFLILCNLINLIIIILICDMLEEKQILKQQYMFVGFQ